MANKGWSQRFDDPIVLDDGTKLTTLREAIQYLAKTVPKAEQRHETVLTAADHLTRSAEQTTPCSLRARPRYKRSTGIAGGCSILIARITIGASGS